jgi:ATP-dependent helicase/DNAse subunit B
MSDDAMRYGSLMHRLCEEMTNNITSFQQESDVRKLIARIAPSYGYFPHQIYSLQGSCSNLLLRFLASPLMAMLRAGAEFYTELPFRLLLPSGIMLRGIIDLIVMNKGKTISIFDYKTSRFIGDHGDTLLTQYKPQIDIYCLAAAELFGKPIEQAALYLLIGEPGREMLSLYNSSQGLTEENFQLALSEANSLALKICSGWSMQHFPRRHPTSTICRDCGYAKLCHRFLGRAKYSTRSHSLPKPTGGL